MSMKKNDFELSKMKYVNATEKYLWQPDKKQLKYFQNLLQRYRKEVKIESASSKDDAVELIRLP